VAPAAQSGPPERRSFLAGRRRQTPKFIFLAIITVSSAKINQQARLAAPPVQPALRNLHGAYRLFRKNDVGNDEDEQSC